MDALKKLGWLPFELAYLALLTSRRIKPLSRWEAALDAGHIDLLGEMGLAVASVGRYSLLGRRLPRVVFSASPRYVEAYARRFDGKRIRHSPEIVRREGWFFGYPSCCVEQFIENPYARNGLGRDDQRILFHWACPDCQSTYSLLREYRLVYRECVRIFGGAVPEVSLSRRFGAGADAYRAIGLGRTLPWAASVAAFAILQGLGGAQGGDPHMLPAPDDSDADGLSYAEEVLLGNSPMLSDSDNDGLTDGVDASQYIKLLIDALPAAPQPADPYIVDFPMDGVEQCAVCGEWVDMGFIRIIHPVRGLEVDVHKIALHYLGHGSIGYDGSLHTGRVDVDMLKRILFPYDPAHIHLPGYDDDDVDQVHNGEEPLVSTDPVNPDTDGDCVKDGCQLAEQLLAVLGSLPREPRMGSPYLVEHPVFGIETCSDCGERMNMGLVEIVNNREGLTLEMPYIAMHHLSHGSFICMGDVHAGERIMPAVLQSVLLGQGDSHWMAVTPDADGDGLTDDEENDLGLDPLIKDTDLDGTPDGPDLAKLYHQLISELPQCDFEVPPFYGLRCVVNYLALGVYQCNVCGEWINMGYMELHDIFGRVVTIPYYNYHYLAHGSFSTDWPSTYPRTDPRDLADFFFEYNISGAENPATPAAAVLTNAPNPFASSTEITIDLPAGTDVEITVFDAAGRRVRDIYSGGVSEGRNAFTWDGRDSSGRVLASGVYFCKLRMGSLALTRKMLKLR